MVGILLFGVLDQAGVWPGVLKVSIKQQEGNVELSVVLAEWQVRWQHVLKVELVLWMRLWLGVFVLHDPFEYLQQVKSSE